MFFYKLDKTAAQVKMAIDEAYGDGLLRSGTCEWFIKVK